VTRLDERGLVVRMACPTDGRAQLIALTGRGRSVLRRAAPALLRALASAFDAISDADLAMVRRVGDRITRIAS
jgi:DNA-binding MarR family transcriptional regulator